MLRFVQRWKIKTSDRRWLVVTWHHCCVLVMFYFGNKRGASVHVSSDAELWIHWMLLWQERWRTATAETHSGPNSQSAAALTLHILRLSLLQLSAGRSGVDLHPAAAGLPSHHRESDPTSTVRCFHADRQFQKNKIVLVQKTSHFFLSTCVTGCWC